MKITKFHLSIGISAPVKLLHISDSHLCHADARDDQRKIDLAVSRSRYFEGESNNCLEFLDEALEYSRKNCDLLVHTGDLMDFVSHKNIDIARERFLCSDVFMAAGNHEFSKYVGEATEDHAYKMSSYPSVQAAFGNDLLFASREINGLNLVAVDNTYYQFNSQQLEMMKKEITKGLPILLLMHTPLYTESLYNEMMNSRKQPCAYVVGCPEEKMSSYSEHRFKQQRATAETWEFLRYLQNQPLIKGILAGHLHFDYHDIWENNVPQYVVGLGSKGDAYEFTIE